MVMFWLHKLLSWVVLWFLLVWPAATLGPDSGVEQTQQWTEFQPWSPAQEAGPQDFSSLWVSAAPSLRHKVPELCLPTPGLTGDVTVNCTVEVQVWRGLQYESKPGDSLSIECPVKYCTEKPAIHWCLIQGMRCLFLKDGPTRHTAWREGNVSVLNFMPIHQSNSGLYRCIATLGSLSTQSHAISVIVRETTDFIPVTHEPQALPCNLADNVVVSLVTGYRAVLSCSNMSLVNLISVVWKIRLRDGACCLLAYKADLNKTVRTNCSERMDWAARPDHHPALQIHPVRLSDEGNYMCEIVNRDGSLHRNYTLSVLEQVGFSLLLHYLLTGGAISCVIIVTILYCTLQHRVLQLSRQVASASVLTKTGNNTSLNTMAAPDNPNVHASGMSGVSHDNQSEDIYENINLIF
ncbi:VPS10 domain-containing receptor SorCS3-like [Platysternon megacephalum]|uniref:VPS10 domain-containing receptor SorCS3-like n=1 Tax=Platysternon megacephalum TaxID=55544 RepID=A0A4D9E9C9_9SAUR|nr:VPS10 domain-containing receptor SorCS3-like [Platysternon megacephalum]